MLSIALGILKIIGIVLFALLGLILLALCLLLFVPVRYEARAAAHGFDIEANVRASWLLKIVRMRYIRNVGKKLLQVYIFWFFKVRIDQDENDAPEAVEEGITEAPPEEIEATPAESSEAKTPKALGRIASGQQKEGLIGRITGMADQINHYRHYPNRNEIISATWSLTKKLCKKLLPKKLRLTGEVGLSSPHNTAYLFAVAGALCLPVSRIKPNFDEQSLSIDLYARGKLSLWSILWPILRYAIRRPIWPLTKKIILRKGDANEQPKPKL